MIETNDVSVELGGTSIITGIGLKASAGQFSTIVGPNGSGKTTLLRALTGELKHSGSIHINGININALSPFAQAAIRGVLPQSSIVSFPFTVREVILLGGADADVSANPKSLNGAIDSALEQVDLDGFAGRNYGELSGGEKQRVQLARVLFRIGSPISESGPRWLFLDEPVSSLDIRHQLQIMSVARSFANSGGGVIAVMHDLNLTAVFADQVLMMNSGRICACGPPQAVLNTGNVSEVFDCDLLVGEVPIDDTPFVLPHTAII